MLNKVILLLMLIVGTSEAKHFHSPTHPDSVQYYIEDSTSTGDTVIIAKGTVTFADEQTMIIDKPIVIRGAGYGETDGYDTTLDSTVLTYSISSNYTPFITINSSVTGKRLLHISNIKFKSNSSGVAHCLYIQAINEYNSVLVDSTVFYRCVGGNVIKSVCKFSGCFSKIAIIGGNKEMTNIWYCNDNQDQADLHWKRSDMLGTRSCVVFENSKFLEGTKGHYVQGTLGAKIVSRYNYAYDSDFDAHNYGFNSRGLMTGEMYGDTIDIDGTFTTTNIRSGTGVIYNNVQRTSNYTWYRFTEYQSSSGFPGCAAAYPAQDQIGRGMRMRANPLYFWNNKDKNNDVVDPLIAAGSGCYIDGQPVTEAYWLQAGRDYIVSAKPNYVPLEYPNPMTTKAISELCFIDSVANSTKLLSPDGGSTIKIYGSGFGSSRGSGNAYVLDSTLASYTTWTNTYIEGVTKVSPPMDSVGVTVRTNSGDGWVLDFAANITDDAPPVPANIINITGVR
jgi:hypothetical protein